MSDRAFNSLARPIQHILWDMGWEALRPIQVDAIHEILERDGDIIISASTAAGKTEAAFLPILSTLYDEPKPSIQAVYVGPLKALINDQFRRLEDLCQRAEIPVHRWHGDVDAGKKRRLLEQPGGVLLITPESVESLFVNRSSSLSRLFRHLSFVVIDEVHALVGCERGTHLRSLLFRLEKHVDRQYRMVALSATLGHAMATYAEWMRPGRAERVCHIHDRREQKGVLYRIRGYTVSRPIGQRDERKKDGPDKDEELPSGIVADMYEAFAGKTNLLFANSKQNVELFADSLNRHCRQMGRPPEFLVHHGSLSKEVREHTEQTMRGSRPCTTLCSATLELGIDIGNVAAVGQIGPPWSVSSLVQRLGRSGRGKGEPRVMRVFVTEREPDAKARLVDRLYPGLLRTVAITELMLKKWVEPPDIDDLDLSTLVQQILSVLAQTGGVKADQLYGMLVTKGVFRTVDQSLFVGVLRSLANNDLIEQMPQGDVILAPKGEQIVNHYDFYSAFATPVEYSVVHNGRPIGRLPALSIPNESDHLLLAGRRWQVARVDHDRSELLVVPARGRKAPRFLGSVGEIHPRVRRTMCDIILNDRTYSYLDETAAQLLSDARRTATSASLATRRLIRLGEEECLWFTWTGTKIQRTLCLMASTADLEATDQDIAIHFSHNPKTVVRDYQKILKAAPAALVLAKHIPGRRLRKFDEYIADELLVQSLAQDAIDIGSAVEAIDALLNDPVDSRTA